jgi:hypothetical protein
LTAVGSLAEHDSQSARDAATRLRYATSVRNRARRATLAPSLALVVLGAVLLAHGLLKTLWPHAVIGSVVLLVGLVAIRPVLRWLVARAEQRRGLQGSTRLRLACGAAGVLGVGVAIALGASPLISGIAAAAAVAAYLAGLPILSSCAIAGGLIAEALVTHGIAPSTGELIIGLCFVALGAAGHAKGLLRS